MIMQGKRECQGKVRFKTSLNSLEREEEWYTEGACGGTSHCKEVPLIPFRIERG